MQQLKRLLVLISLTIVLGACGGGGSNSSSSGGGSAATSSNTWTWMGGSKLVNQSGTYGTLGTAAVGNVPGGRAGAVSWLDASGNLWLFGGAGYDSVGTWSKLSDLWRWDGSQWTWMGGSNTGNQSGTYGTLGTAAAGNVPGGRNGVVSWLDASGNLWLFGGYGVDDANTWGKLNDLWRWDGSQWTWMSGSDMANQAGSYGTLGTPAASNIPGGRTGAVSWTDASGNLWLFGGFGYDSVLSADPDLNDLWRWDGSQWTWMGGSDISNQAGSYGTLGTAATDNIPGARHDAVSWLDASDNLWLFGGIGVGSASARDRLNDLWRWDGSQWTWMSGSNTINQFGTYGTQGTSAADNIPGARYNVVSWLDASGGLWLFGGAGYDSAGTRDRLNDLWRYQP